MSKLQVLFFTSCLLIISGCGTSSGGAGGNVTVSPTSAVVAAGQSTQFTATSTDGKPVQWFVNGLANANPLAGSIDSQGHFTASSNAGGTDVLLMAESGNQSRAVATVHVISAGQAVQTQHPLVAQYTIAAPAGGTAFIEFGPTTDYGRSTWKQPAPPNGGNIQLQVAGMLASTQYHMRAVVEFPDGTSYQDQDKVFTTGALPAGAFPTITTQTTPGQTPQPGVEMVDIGAVTNFRTFVTDLAGNVIWWYQAPDGSASDSVQGLRLLPNGHFLMNFNPAAETNLLGFALPAGTVKALREVDLAGNTVREVNVQQINDRLAAAGFNLQIDVMHHEVIVLPNGHWLVIANHLKTFPNLIGFSTPTTVLGDDIIDLDTSLNPVWVWSGFDHLDVNRHPAGFPDWMHSNALVYLPDGNLLLSIRHQSWVIKIDYRDGKGTGDILWKLGEGGDFTLLGGNEPTDWFSGQHGPAVFATTSDPSVYSISLMDNGNFRTLPAGVDCTTLGVTPCPFSTASILQLDEKAMTANLTFRDIPGGFSFFGGNTTLLPNGNLEADFCSVGSNPSHSMVRELNPAGGDTPVWQMDITGEFAYRAFRMTSLYPGVQW